MTIDIDGQLRRHDCEPDRPLTADEALTASALLARITSQLEPAPRRATARRSRIALLAIPSAAAVAIAVIGGAHLLRRDGTHPSAQHLGTTDLSLTAADIASWSAMPASVSPTSPEVVALAAKCIAPFDEAPAAAKQRPIVGLVDRRGSVTLLTVSDTEGHVTISCWVDSKGIESTELIDRRFNGIPDAEPGTINTAMGGGGGSQVAGDGVQYATYGGQVGANVTGVFFTTAAGEKVTASVGGGWWGMWWVEPKVQPLTGGTFSWTTTDGVTHTEPAADLLHDD